MFSREGARFARSLVSCLVLLVYLVVGLLEHVYLDTCVARYRWGQSDLSRRMHGFLFGV